MDGTLIKNSMFLKKLRIYRKQSIEKGNKIELKWKSLFENYRKEFPELAAELEQMQKGELPDGWDSDLPVFNSDTKGISGRKASNSAMNAISSKSPMADRWFSRPGSFYFYFNQ